VNFIISSSVFTVNILCNIGLYHGMIQCGYKKWFLSWLLSVISILLVVCQNSACFLLFKIQPSFQNYLILHLHNLLASATFNRIFLFFTSFEKLFSVPYQNKNWLYFPDLLVLLNIQRNIKFNLSIHILISSPCLPSTKNLDCFIVDNFNISIKQFVSVI
jgi:hypothetical protein